MVHEHSTNRVITNVFRLEIEKKMVEENYSVKQVASENGIKVPTMRKILKGQKSVRGSTWHALNDWVSK